MLTPIVLALAMVTAYLTSRYILGFLGRVAGEREAQFIQDVTPFLTILCVGGGLGIGVVPVVQTNVVLKLLTIPFAALGILLFLTGPIIATVFGRACDGRTKRKLPTARVIKVPLSWQRLRPGRRDSQPEADIDQPRSQKWAAILRGSSGAPGERRLFKSKAGSADHD